MFSSNHISLFGVLLLAAAPVFSFPALGGPVNSPFGSPSQAIFNPTGGNIIYRSASQVPQGQLIPANSELAQKATGGKGRCNVYYYCCIFYCWSKWTPCGCYLVCADSGQEGTGELIPVADTKTTNEFFDPPSATPPSVPSGGGRADIVPHEDDDHDDGHHDNDYVEVTPPMMGPGNDKKLTDDDERETVLVDFETERTRPVQFVTTQPPEEVDEEEIGEPDPNEAVGPEWEDHQTTTAYVPPVYEPIEEEEDPANQPDTFPEVEPPYIEDGEEPVEDGVDEVEQQDDDTLIAFGQVQGRRPLLVRFPQTGVAFEARARSSDRQVRAAGDKKEKKQKHGGNKDKSGENKKNKKNKADRQLEREERRRERQERKQRKSKQQANVDSKFIW